MSMNPVAGATPSLSSIHLANSLYRSNDSLKGTPNGVPGIAQQLPQIQDPATRQAITQLARAINDTNHAVVSLANTSGAIQDPAALERQIVAAPVVMYLA